MEEYTTSTRTTHTKRRSPPLAGAAFLIARSRSYVQDLRPRFNRLRAYFHFEAMPPSSSSLSSSSLSPSSLSPPPPVRTWPVCDHRLLFSDFQEALGLWTDVNLPHYLVDESNCTWTAPLQVVFDHQRVVDVLAYRINRLHTLLEHHSLFEEWVSLLLHAFIDTHLPMVYVIEKNNNQLPLDWATRCHPDAMGPCFEGSLPNAVPLLTGCLEWNDTKEHKQPIVRLLAKTMPRPCFFRSTFDITLSAYIAQQSVYDAQHPESANQARELARRVQQTFQTSVRRDRVAASSASSSSIATNDLTPPSRSKSRRTTPTLMPYERIPESDDLLDFLRRILLCTLLGNFTLATVRATFRRRIELYRFFEFEASRFDVLYWLSRHPGVEFYALKSYMLYIAPMDLGLFKYLQQGANWSQYVRTTVDGCDRHVRGNINTHGLDLDVERQLAKLRKAQFDTMPRSKKVRYSDHVLKVLHKLFKVQGLNRTEVVNTELSLTLQEHIRSTATRMPPHADFDGESPDWHALVAFGLSTMSIMQLQVINDM